jgi:hypothetical protein
MNGTQIYGDGVEIRDSVGATATELKPAARNLLIDHIDGDRPVRRAEPVAAIGALLRRELIDYKPSGAIAPTHSVITERGRVVLSFILAEYADALVRAGYLDRRPESLPPPLTVFPYRREA